jgi:hypothetical protein
MDSLLQETGFKILQETGEAILLEQQVWLKTASVAVSNSAFGLTIH